MEKVLPLVVTHGLAFASGLLLGMGSPLGGFIAGAVGLVAVFAWSRMGN